MNVDGDQAERTGYGLRHAVILATQIALAAALFGLLLVSAERHNRRFDLTPSQAYVLSPGATRVAQGVQVPLRILAFYNSQDSDQRRQMDDILTLFADATPKLSYRLVDLDRSPALAKRYGVRSFGSGIMEIDGGEVRELRAIDEEEITNAILKLTRHKVRNLCFVTAHGERSPQDTDERRGYSLVGKAVEKEHFEVVTLDAVPIEDLAQKCTVIVLAGPKRELLDGEADSLTRFLQDGGRVLLLLDSDAAPSSIALARRHGVAVGDDVIVDERNRLYGADSYMARVPIFAKELFGSNLDTAAVFPVARSVEPAAETPAGLAVLRIALSTDESYARVGATAPPDEEVHFRPEVDHPGPLTVGVLVASRESAPIPLDDTGTIDDSRRGFGQMIVLGDADFASNLYLNVLGNKDLVLSCLGALAEDADLISVRRKSLPASSLSPIYLTADQGRTIFWIAVVILPGTFALLGILITWRRRYKAST